ncbi:hypothetical protein EDB81DRAFT_772479 [Dactylonectria macrodidyma]|uniref:DNA damage-responsive protein 48 n=1 Tax=Dactylonectria macrodidyma TaxID=307937 RepID=A0A9P9FU97_9HYPO|nr:hypothetical protein EDB81DRAFT_772479 [Dactylonectria macrodidyma]
MNFFKGDSDRKTEETPADSNSGGGGFMDKVNNFAGGGAKGEKNEDGLDKAVDYVQENFLGQGNQSNESAAEQAKDEAISDFVRDKYKTTTGKEFFVADKDKNYGA